MNRERARELLSAAQELVAFSGAGISTESGIPDFRSPGGIWETYTPVMIDEFRADPEARARYWRYKLETRRAFADARPNAAHRALAERAEAGRLLGMITQNIDGLHQAAGMSDSLVVELHGSNAKVGCLACDAEAGWAEAEAQMDAGAPFPVCRECEGLLKPRTVSFGQSLPLASLERAAEWSQSGDVYLVIGTSLEVSPANQFPLLAHSAGVPVVILNRTPTPQDHIAAAVVRGDAAALLPGLLA